MVDDLFTPAAVEAAAPPIASDVTLPLDDDALAELVMAWAREQHPDKAAHVESKRGDSNMFRRLCGRLIELRWADDAAWRHTVPLMALHETALVIQFRAPLTNTVLTVSGRHAPKPHRWTFFELAHHERAALELHDTSAFHALVVAKDTLDLVHYP